jgi:hypothetical protein
MAFRTKTRNRDVRKAISALKTAFGSLEGWELVQSGPKSFVWLQRDGVLCIRIHAVLRDAEPSSCWVSVGECDRVTPFVTVKWEEGVVDSVYFDAAGRRYRMPQRDENLLGTLLVQTCKKLTQQTLNQINTTASQNTG